MEQIATQSYREDPLRIAEPYIAGVEAGKDAHTVVFLDSVGNVLRSLMIPADAAGHEQALALARSLGGEVFWGLESIGCHSRSFARALIASGAVVYEVPGSFKRLRRRSGRTVRANRLDAQAIAEAVLREAHRLPRFEESGKREALRLRDDQRDRLVHQRTEAVNRLRSAVLRLDHGGLPTELVSVQGMSWIQEIIVSAGTITTDGVVQALLDDLRFAIEDVHRINARIEVLEALLGPMMHRRAC